MAWSFVLTQLMLNGKAGATLIWVAQGSILVHWWDVSMHNRFALVSSNLPTGFVVSNEKSAGFSLTNLLQTDLGYQSKFTPLHFCLDFKLGPWYEFILWHPPSPFFWWHLAARNFLPSKSLGCFAGEERRLQNPRSVGNFSAGIGDGDLTNDWSTCVGETGKLEQMVQQNVMGCFVFWFGKCCSRIESTCLVFNLFRLQRLVFLAFLISIQTPAGQELLNAQLGSVAETQQIWRLFVCLFFFGLGVVWGFGQLPCVGPNKFRVIKVYQVQHGPSWWADVSGDFAVTGTKSDAAAKRVRHLTAGRRGARGKTNSLKGW